MFIHICTVEDAAQTHRSAELLFWLHEEYDAGEESSTLFSSKNKTNVLSKVILFISMVELDQQISAVNTMFNKMGLNA